MILSHILASAPPGTPPIAVPFPHSPATIDTVQVILQIFFGLAGGVALVVIVLSGLRLVTANGDPDAIARARNTVTYALIGLIVCITSMGIVTFVLNRVK